MINVLIADDHKIVVDGLSSILEHETNINVVGTAANGCEVMDLIENRRIDIAVLDIEMPGGSNGIELTKCIREKYPAIKVLILSMYKTSNFVTKAIESGASGYILKNKGGEELVKAIKILFTGDSYIGQEITHVFFDSLRTKKKEFEKNTFKLTKREKEVLSLIAKGITSIEIGKQLFIAASTVDTHRRNLIDKIGVSNSKELIIYAIENHLTN